MDSKVPLSVDNSYLAGYFDHSHVSHKNRYKQTDSYNRGVLVAINMIIRISLFEQPFLDEDFDSKLLHQLHLLYCYVFKNLYEKHRKYLSQFNKSKKKELSGAHSNSFLYYFEDKSKKYDILEYTLE